MRTPMKLIAAAVLSAALSAQAQDAVRPDVGKPLQAAQELMKSRRFGEALAKIGIVGNEQYVK